MFRSNVSMFEFASLSSTSKVRDPERCNCAAGRGQTEAVVRFK